MMVRPIRNGSNIPSIVVETVHMLWAGPLTIIASFNTTRTTMAHLTPPSTFRTELGWVAATRASARALCVSRGSFMVKGMTTQGDQTFSHLDLSSRRSCAIPQLL
jgi:hypothetical protein